MTEVYTARFCLRVGRKVAVIVETRNVYGSSRIVACVEPKTPLCKGCTFNVQNFREASYVNHRQTDPYTLAMQLSHEIKRRH